MKKLLAILLINFCLLGCSGWQEKSLTALEKIRSIASEYDQKAAPLIKTTCSTISVFCGLKNVAEPNCQPFIMCLEIGLKLKQAVQSLDLLTATAASALKIEDFQTFTATLIKANETIQKIAKLIDEIGVLYEQFSNQYNSQGSRPSNKRNSERSRPGLQI